MKKPDDGILMVPHHGLWNLDDHLSTTLEALDALKEMIKHSRQAMVLERKQAEKEALRRAKGMRIYGYGDMDKSDQLFHRVLAAYSTLLDKYCGYLPRLINYGILLQLYALFEERGVALCNELKERDNTIKVSISDFDNREFKTIQTYLTKICDVQFAYWSEIELLSQLRHRIVHNNGYTGNAKLIARIQKTKGLAVHKPHEPPAVTDETDVSMLPDPSFVPPFPPEKLKPLIIVRQAYVDHIVKVVTSLFEKVFQEKKFGNRSPFSQRRGDAPLVIKGPLKKLRVEVVYQD